MNCAGPVTERALKVALTVTENVIKKDFSLNPDESQLRYLLLLVLIFFYFLKQQ